MKKILKAVFSWYSCIGFGVIMAVILLVYGFLGEPVDMEILASWVVGIEILLIIGFVVCIFLPSDSE